MISCCHGVGRDSQEKERTEMITTTEFKKTTGFPTVRMRRLRMTETIREMVRETTLQPSDFIYPMFVVPGSKVRHEISSMPNVFQLSVDELVRECTNVYDAGVKSVILFGIPSHKDEYGSEAYDENGIVQRAIRELKKEIPELFIITDVCLCEYTSHGHCGILRETAPGQAEILNDETLELLAKESLTHVQAGADMVAPTNTVPSTNQRHFGCEVK